ncbi:F-box protein At3g07870 [Linum grandiflorum]
MTKKSIFSFAATKEYKVVTIASAIDRPSFRFRIFPGSVISVLTLAPAKATKSSESTSWRRIGGLVPYHFENQTHQVPVMGRLHWAARRRDNRSWKHLLIMSFDLSDETIKEVSMLPVQFDRNFHCRFELMVVGSCLGVAEYKVGGEIKIWVMKEYGLESSWVNEITVETTSLGNPDGMRRSSSCTYFHMMSDFRVLWVLRNGDVLLEFKRRGLVLYDPMNGILKNVWIREGRFKFNAIVHEGSFCDINACINI